MNVTKERKLFYAYEEQSYFGKQQYNQGQQFKTYQIILIDKNDYINKVKVTIWDFKIYDYHYHFIENMMHFLTDKSVSEFFINQINRQR